MIPANEVTPERYERYVNQRGAIKYRLDRIERDTAFDSGVAYLGHPMFRELLESGPKIIPFVVHDDVVEEGASWVKLGLLRELSGQSPVPPEHAGRLLHQVADWINWFVASEYYASDDVYHGLA